MRGGLEAYLRAALPVAKRIVARERLEIQYGRPLFSILNEAMAEANHDREKVAAKLGVEVECIDGWLIKQAEVEADPAEQEMWDRSYLRRAVELRTEAAAAKETI